MPPHQVTVLGSNAAPCGLFQVSGQAVRAPQQPTSPWPTRYLIRRPVWTFNSALVLPAVSSTGAPLPWILLPPSPSPRFPHLA